MSKVDDTFNHPWIMGKYCDYDTYIGVFFSIGCLAHFSLRGKEFETKYTNDL